MAEVQRPEDPEMVALRAFAAEVVRAAGGVPARRGYRPRLDARPALAFSPRALVAELGGIVGSVRARPRRTLGFALAGCGATAVAVLLLRAAIVPGDASLELIAARPAPLGASVPAPSPPPETLLVEAPARAPAPPPEAPAKAPAPPPPAPAPVVSTRDALRALTAEKAPAGKRAAAPGKLAAKETAAQRRAGRRSDAALAGASRAAATRPVSSPARTRKEASASGLDRREILAAMQPVQLLVQRCYQRYGEKGVANAGIEVGKRGEVKKVTITGPLARTSTAACLKSAVKTAHFQGGGTTFHYPLVVQ
jgi:hypothetical protein